MPRASERPRWPSSLVDRIRVQDAVLFVGAGLSANAANGAGVSPPLWRELLSGLAADLLSSQSQRVVRTLLRAGAYLSAAERLEYECVRSGRGADFREAIVRACDGPDDDLFVGGAVHDLVGELNPRIIVTTNYDRILERKFGSGYRVKHYRDSDIAAEIRRGQPVLLKLHGSYDAPAGTVLTRTDFTRLRREGGHAIETVQALLATRTVLFAGYGIGDPDLQLMLENLFGAQGQQAGHFMLGPNTMPEPDRQVLHDVYGVDVLKYGGGVEGFKESLSALVDEVRAGRIV